MNLRAFALAVIDADEQSPQAGAVCPARVRSPVLSRVAISSVDRRPRPAATMVPLKIRTMFFKMRCPRLRCKWPRIVWRYQHIDAFHGADGGFALTIGGTKGPEVMASDENFRSGAHLFQIEWKTNVPVVATVQRRSNVAVPDLVAIELAAR